MNKYYKAEDVIRKYAEMIADEAYWEHGVGDGKPDEEDLDIAREYYSDLPTIDIVRCEDCRHSTYTVKNRVTHETFYACPYSCINHEGKFFCAYGERNRQ